jgi:hypothetical protein
VIDSGLAALTRAWVVTLIAIISLSLALAVARNGEAAVTYWRALPAALSCEM